MHILFISIPDKPPATSGRDQALPKSLAMLGHEVTVVHPLLTTIDPSRRGFARRLTEISADDVPLTLFDGRATRGVHSHYLQHASFTPPLSAQACKLFGAAVSSFTKDHVKNAEVLVVEDHAGHCAALALIESGWQGPVIAHVTTRWQNMSASEQDALRALAGHGAHLSVSSEAVSAAIKLELEKATVVVLRDGIDAAHWNPTTDPLISGRFDPVDLSGKQLCKRELQQQFELPVSEDLPFVAAVVASKKGLAAAEASADEILRNDCQLGLLLRGQQWDADTLSALTERWPDRVQVLQDDDPALEHQLVAGADIFLVLDPDDLSGTWAQIAQRYGAVPVAPNTDVAREALVDCTADMKSGSAFLYDEEELTRGTRRALAGYAHIQAFAAAQRRVMRIEHSWERTARTLLASSSQAKDGVDHADPRD